MTKTKTRLFMAAIMAVIMMRQLVRNTKKRMNNMSEITKLGISAMILLAVLLLGLYLSVDKPIWIWQREEPVAQPVWDVNDLVLPAPSDIQELLNRLEPEPRIAVDGKIGPQTMDKWNRVYSEISAKQYFGR